MVRECPICHKFNVYGRNSRCVRCEIERMDWKKREQKNVA